MEDHRFDMDGRSVKRIRELCPTAPLKGCTTEELSALEAYAGRKLPQAYRSFMLLMGKDACGLTGEWWFQFYDVFGLTEHLLENLELTTIIHDSFVGPAFAIGIESGGPTVFIENDGSTEDPRVFIELETTGVEKIADVFSDFIVDVVACYSPMIQFPHGEAT